MPANRGRGRGSRGGGRAGYYTPQAPSSKRVRVPSDDQDEDVEIDPEQLLDSLLACLTKNESLLDRFVAHLLKIPALQDRIAQLVISSIDPSGTSSDDSSATLGDGTDKSNIAKCFIDTIQGLTQAVNDLKTELKTSAHRCDELEQYSRRNNIIISGIPESDHTDTETQVVNFLNDYSGEMIEPGLIDRCHRLQKRNAKKGPGQRAPDIIVKFVTHKCKAAILSKEPMEKLREDNKGRDDASKLYVREDLTKKRGTILYKARQLKKASLIKDAFSRDGIITIRMATSKPSGHDMYYRITSEDELKAFCNDKKLDVNDECLPKKTVKPKTLVFSMSAGGSAAHGSVAHHAGTPMDSQEESDLNPDAQAFQPSNNSDAGTVNEPAS